MRNTFINRILHPLGFVALLMLGGGCIDSALLQQAIRDAATQAKSEMRSDATDKSAEERPTRELGGVDVQVEGDGEKAALLDSLLRLVAQDVGIDPDEGSVQKAIWRVKVIKLNLQTARRSLDNSRQEIFSMAATAEELKALKEIDERIAATPDSTSGDLILERQRLQDDAIDRAKTDGTLQQKKLSGDQAKRVGLLLYNLGVGVVCDNLAINGMQHLEKDFKRVHKDFFGGDGLKALVAGAGVVKYRREFFGLPHDFKSILIEAPSQVSALTAMMGTIKVLKENNQIEEREPKPGDAFEVIEDF